MKLRNKYTGNIRDFESLNLIVRAEEPEDGFESWNDYRSLAEFNEEWEDYKPAEPLIKDRKIRKAVRAWWESIPLEESDKRVLYKKNQDLAVGVYTIYCGAIYPEGTLKVGKYYTIAELCGEEEE